MSRMMIEAGTPPMRRAATPWSNRLAAVLTLGVLAVAVGFAYPTSGMSSTYIDESVPQIVKMSGP